MVKKQYKDTAKSGTRKKEDAAGKAGAHSNALASAMETLERESAPDESAAPQRYTNALALNVNESRASFRNALFQEPLTQSLTHITSAADIGRLVRAARRRMDLNQQAFADIAGVGRRFLSELEGGKPTLEFDKVLQVCAAAGIDLSAAQRVPQT